MTAKTTDRQKESPPRSPAGNRTAEAREARLAAALRTNLQRRKAQSRTRDAVPPETRKP
jgi:hypothetical protein